MPILCGFLFSTFRMNFFKTDINLKTYINTRFLTIQAVCVSFLEYENINKNILRKHSAYKYFEKTRGRFITAMKHKENRLLIFSPPSFFPYATNIKNGAYYFFRIDAPHIPINDIKFCKSIYCFQNSNVSFR